jgi:DNA-binding GntR family transcriptional regulator
MTRGQNGTLGKQAYEILQERILKGEYPPGSILSKRRLTVDLKMSSPPVTEALKRLENEGLLKTVPRIGARITIPSPTEVRCILDVREALECHTARLCNQRATKQQRQELEGMARQLDELMQGEKLPPSDLSTRFRRADRELHLKIAEYSQSTRLWELLRQTLTAYQGLANLVPVRQKPGAAAWHKQLIHTILEKDVVEAEEAMRTHVQQALESLLVGLQIYMVWDEKRLLDVWATD